jgi:hypothetical protein
MVALSPVFYLHSNLGPIVNIIKQNLQGTHKCILIEETVTDVNTLLN